MYIIVGRFGRFVWSVGLFRFDRFVLVVSLVSLVLFRFAHGFV